MKIKELNIKAENLIEQSERTKKEIDARRRQVANAQFDIQEAKRMLEAAMEKDSEGNYKGDPRLVSLSLDTAMERLRIAQEELRVSEGALNEINAEKRATIDSVKRYNEVEKQNLKKLEILKNKRFGGNVNAFVADIIDRMEQGENIQKLLHESLGEEYSKENFGNAGNGSDAEISSRQDNGTSNVGVHEEAKTIISHIVRKPNKSHNVVYDGEPGNSRAYLKKDYSITIKEKEYSYDELNAYMLSKGQDYVEYVNYSPDFLPFVDDELGPVYLEEVSYRRGGEKGNLTKADAVWAKRLWARDNGLQEQQITDEAFEPYKKQYEKKVERIRRDRNIERHEDERRKAVLPVPAFIHRTFRHSGLIAQEKNIKIMQTYWNKITNGQKVRIVKSNACKCVYFDEKVYNKWFKKELGNIKKELNLK